MFIDKVRGASRIAAVDRVARIYGLAPGFALADARARLPMLRAVAFNALADAAFLAQLADIAVAFTPSVALDAPDGLSLDITGCAHLFEGELGLAARLQAAFQIHGVSLCRIAIAPTPDMARALAHFGQMPASITPAPAPPALITHDDRDVRALPVAALECSEEDARALRRAGLKTIGAVADRPSVLFTSRFSAAFTVKLVRVLGEEDRRITPLRSPPPYVADCPCPEPVSNHAVIEGIVHDLAGRMAVQLQARGEGGRVFETTFFRSDGAICRIRLETSKPTRDPDIVLRLYRDRLAALDDPLDPGFGLDLIRLQVLRAEPSHITQTSLDAHDQTSEQLGHLIDRLGTMFGRERITRLHPVDTHIPERAEVRRPAADVKRLAGSNAVHDAPLPARPLFMFGRPHPIEAVGSEDNGTDENNAPPRFRWRRVLHDVVRAEGPERIADEWWRPPSGFGTRDYYRVETAQGRRFWIFRADAAPLPAPAPAPVEPSIDALEYPLDNLARAKQWFLHGVFP